MTEIVIDDEFNLSTLINESEVVIDSSFLNKDGEVEWPPFEGFTNDGFKAIAQEISLTKYEKIDRYGASTGRFVCPVINDKMFEYEERSLPYCKNSLKYHLFQIRALSSYDYNSTLPYTFKGVEYDIIKIKLDQRNYTMDDLLRCYEGKVAPAFNQKGGAIQIKLIDDINTFLDVGLMMELEKNE